MSVLRASPRRRELTDNRQPTTDNRYRAAAVIAMIVFAPALFGCPVCFGAPDDPMIKGVNNGIWVLLSLVGVVQIGFIAMFFSFWRRAREQKRFRDSLQVIHSYDREGPFS
ncbi:MAG TPA: hypothetical protein VGQ76_19105 [Thermoanaerobaculia bacterium]|nr:hypothetical protein [Thermoanaerobaculia bacterium]